MKKLLTNNIGLKIVSVFVAALLWLIVVNIDDPVGTRKFEVSVEVLNEDVITGEGKTYDILDNTNTVTVTVTAKRSVIDNMKRSDLAATADFKELSVYEAVPIKVVSVRYESKIDRIE